MYSTPRDIASFLGILLIFLLLEKRNLKTSYLFLAIIITPSIIIYHPVSSSFILAILLVIYGLQNIYGSVKDKNFITITYLVFTFVFTLGYWIYNAEKIFRIVTMFIYLPSVNLSISQYLSINELFNYLQYGMLLFFIIIGVMGILKSNDLPSLTKIFSMVGFMAVIVTFPGPLLLLPKTISKNITRFAIYTFLFISLTGAAGFAITYYKSCKYRKLLPILLFISMSFLSVSNEFVASDNPLVKREFSTYYLTEEEITSFNHVASTMKGYLMSDYITCRYLYSSVYSDKVNVLEVDNNNMEFLRNSIDDVILIRINELSKRPLKLYQSNIRKFIFRPSLFGKLDYYYSDSLLWKTLANYNIIYDSGGVVGYG